MNRRGQYGIAILTSIGILIVGLMFVNFLMPEITNFRINLNCASASTISSGTKVLCLIGDSTVIYFIIAIFSLAIGMITSKMRSAA